MGERGGKRERGEKREGERGEGGEERGGERGTEKEHQHFCISTNFISEEIKNMVVLGNSLLHVCTITLCCSPTQIFYVINNPKSKNHNSKKEYSNANNPKKGRGNE